MISLLLVLTDPGHSTIFLDGDFSFIGTDRSWSWHQISGWFILLFCTGLSYGVVIARAHLSRMEGSWWLVVVLLIVYSDRAGREYSPPSFVTRSVLVLSDPTE